MTAPEHIAARCKEALAELAEILERHDPELSSRVSKVNHGEGRIPGVAKQPLEHSAFVAECLRSLGRIVDEQLTPKKRGRPRKNVG